jgi:hypothetical protein
MTWTRCRRRELKRQVEIAADIADQRLAAALAEGLISLSDLPPDAAQRIAALDERVLQGRIVGGEIVIEKETR